MPVIPRSERRVGINPSPTPDIRTSGGEIAGRALQGLGHGLTAAGRGFADLMGDAQKERDKLDEYQANTAVARFHAEQDKRQVEYDLNISGDGRNHTAGRLGEYDAARDNLVKTLPNNERVRQRAMLQLEQMRGNYGTQSYRRQTEHLGNYYASETTKTVEGAYLPRLTGDPKSLQEYWAASDMAIEATPNLTPERRERMKEAAAKIAAQRWIDLAGPDASDRAAEIRNQYLKDNPQAKFPVAPESVGESYKAPPVPVISGPRPVGYWGNDSRWQALDKYQKAAAMALMEADGRDPVAAKNALGAMVNRAHREGVDLGDHVSTRKYQPTIEPAQFARLQSIINSDQFKELTQLAYARANGKVDDWTGGATHFLAHEGVMLALERGNPSKYRDWGPRGSNWSGFDPGTGRYRTVTMRDGSHAFIAPEGNHSAPGPGSKVTSPNEGLDTGGADVAPVPPGRMTTRDYFARELFQNSRHIEKLAAERREEIANRALVEGQLKGEVPFNPQAKEDRDRVDAVFEGSSIVKGLFAGDEGSMRAAAENSMALGYVPKPIAEGIAGLVRQSDPQRRANGYRSAAAILANQPYAFDAVQGGKDIKDKALDYTALVSTRNLSPQEALLRMDEMAKPEWQAKESARKKEFDGPSGLGIGITESVVRSQFDDSWLGLMPNPSGQGIGSQGAVMTENFRQAVREHYIRHGDMDVAKTLAAGEMKRAWGVSEVTGSKVLTKYPPEKFYPAIGDKGHAYIGADLKASVKDFTGKDVPLDRIAIEADGRTQQDINNARPGEPARPSYRVWFRNEFGVDQLLPRRWAPDPDKPTKEFHAEFAAERDKVRPTPTATSEAAPVEQQSMAPHMILRRALQSEKAKAEEEKAAGVDAGQEILRNPGQRKRNPVDVLDNSKRDR